MAPVVKPTPNGRVFTFLAGLSGAVALLFFFLAYLVGSGGLPTPDVALLAIAVVCALMSVGTAWGAWFWWRLERRRQAAARGDAAHVFSVAEPPRTLMILPPIATISVRMKWGAKVLIWAYTALLVVAVAGGGANDHGFLDYRFFLTLLGALGGGSFLARLHTGERRIEVTDDWLSAGVGPFQEIIPWEEARLFALTRGKRRKRTTISYELSSAEAMAAWMWLRPDTFSARLFEPTIPQYEYDRQMEALLALIAAKTGLPLYDLR